MKIRAIVTGATGMVGEGVLHECLLHTDVEQVLVVGRKSCGIVHPKLKEIVHGNFFDLSPIADQLINYNACFFCLGVSSVGMKESEYNHLTYDLTIHVAEILLERNKDMTFCYISGAHTDSSEIGKSMWARVKGKTENKLLSMSFKNAFMFRPGYMQPTKGLKNTLKAYVFLSWLYPVWRGLFPKLVCTLKEVGIAMINVTLKGYNRHVLEVSDIVALANN
ncbi:MAG: epimerase [Bacteroidetes bacterium]|nr:epimerase [Bacteroidota bacterium]